MAWANFAEGGINRKLVPSNGETISNLATISPITGVIVSSGKITLEEGVTIELRNNVFLNIDKNLEFNGRDGTSFFRQTSNAGPIGITHFGEAREITQIGDVNIANLFQNVHGDKVGLNVENLALKVKSTIDITGNLQMSNNGSLNIEGLGTGNISVNFDPSSVVDFGTMNLKKCDFNVSSVDADYTDYTFTLDDSEFILPITFPNNIILDIDVITSSSSGQDIVFTAGVGDLTANIDNLPSVGTIVAGLSGTLSAGQKRVLQQRKDVNVASEVRVNSENITNNTDIKLVISDEVGSHNEVLDVTDGAGDFTFSLRTDAFSGTEPVEVNPLFADNEYFSFTGVFYGKKLVSNQVKSINEPTLNAVLLFTDEDDFIKTKSQAEETIENFSLQDVYDIINTLKEDNADYPQPSKYIVEKENNILLFKSGTKLVFDSSATDLVTLDISTDTVTLKFDTLSLSGELDAISCGSLEVKDGALLPNNIIIKGNLILNGTGVIDIPNGSVINGEVQLRNGGNYDFSGGCINGGIRNLGDNDISVIARNISNIQKLTDGAGVLAFTEFSTGTTTINQGSETDITGLENQVQAILNIVARTKFLTIGNVTFPLGDPTRELSLANTFNKNSITKQQAGDASFNIETVIKRVLTTNFRYLSLLYTDSTLKKVNCGLVNTKTGKTFFNSSALLSSFEDGDQDLVSSGSTLREFDLLGGEAQLQIQISNTNNTLVDGSYSVANLTLDADITTGGFKLQYDSTDSAEITEITADSIETALTAIGFTGGRSASKDGLFYFTASDIGKDIGDISIVDDTTGRNIDINYSIPSKIIYLASEPTQGSYKLEFDGEETGSIPFDATINDIATALSLLSNVSSGMIKFIDDFTSNARFFRGIKITSPQITDVRKLTISQSALVNQSGASVAITEVNSSGAKAELNIERFSFNMEDSSSLGYSILANEKTDFKVADLNDDFGGTKISVTTANNKENLELSENQEHLMLCLTQNINVFDIMGIRFSLNEQESNSTL